MIGGIYNSMTAEWRQVMRSLLGCEGSGIVDFDRVIQTNADFFRSLEEKHDIFYEPDYWKNLLIQASLAWWEPPVHTQADFAKITDPTLFWCGDWDVFCPRNNLWKSTGWWINPNWLLFQMQLISR
ncbi:MAG TPA: hypothetical protein VMW34_05540 [Anaerolineales bacterium]|nr:hypothetical protein [Anaerolineales bacterium]